MKTEITKAQWDRYHIEVADHEKFIKDYKFFLERICRHLDWVNKEKAWTPEEIRKVMYSEIDKAHSMDAPNEPGYYHANND
jgi:hypothetical protein